MSDLGCQLRAMVAEGVPKIHKRARFHSLEELGREGFRKENERRFWEKVDILSDDECWNWTAYTFFRFGEYRGVVWFMDKSELAHRVAAMIIHGKPPFKDAVTRHSCDNTICCNPKHLEWGTQLENVGDCIERDRWKSIARDNLEKTHCKRGHEFNKENTYLFKGGRACKLCMPIHSINHRKKKKVMPRSNTNWPSLRRQEYLEDMLLKRGFTNRQQLVDYFGIERSLGSMDITAYGKLAAIRKAKSGETIEGEVIKGYKLGGKLYYIPAEGQWEGVTGSTQERISAWDLLPHGLEGGLDQWFAAVISAYLSDGNTDLKNYFGIPDIDAERFPLSEKNLERAKVWRLFTNEPR